MTRLYALARKVLEELDATFIVVYKDSTIWVQSAELVWADADFPPFRSTGGTITREEANRLTWFPVTEAERLVDRVEKRLQRGAP